MGQPRLLTDVDKPSNGSISGNLAQPLPVPDAGLVQRAAQSQVNGGLAGSREGLALGPAVSERAAGLGQQLGQPAPGVLAHGPVKLGQLHRDPGSPRVPVLPGDADDRLTFGLGRPAQADRAGQVATRAFERPAGRGQKPPELVGLVAGGSGGAGRHGWPAVLSNTGSP